MDKTGDFLVRVAGKAVNSLVCGFLYAWFEVVWKGKYR